jgi:hypothetical protein
VSVNISRGADRAAGSANAVAETVNKSAEVDPILSGLLTELRVVLGGGAGRATEPGS